MNEAARAKAFEDEMLKRLDPKGEMTEIINVFWPLIDSRPGRAILWMLKGTGLDLEQVRGPISKARELTSGMAQANMLFRPLSWAPSSRLPVDIYLDALDVYKRTRSVDQAEQHLLEGWNEENRLYDYLRPVQAIGIGHDKLRGIAEQRWRLVEKALAHHRVGDYEASVPIVLAQVDGICLDLTDSKGEFFKKKDRSHSFTDTTTIAGMPEGLEHLRPLFSEHMQQSGVTGRLSRHGILHGRELGYDTLPNSTKAFVLLLAVMEWAQARAHALVKRMQEEREARYVGINETDESGRRLDRRGFFEAKDSLQGLRGTQARVFERDGDYITDLDQLGGDRFLHGKANVWLEVSPDHKEYLAWRATPSGFCFAVAGRNGQDWLYAGPVPPADGPGSGADWKAMKDDPWPPDWSL